MRTDEIKLRVWLVTYPYGEGGERSTIVQADEFGINNTGDLLFFIRLREMHAFAKGSWTCVAEREMEG